MVFTKEQMRILTALASGSCLMVRQATEEWHLDTKWVSRDDVRALVRAHTINVPGAWSDKTFLYAEITDTGYELVATRERSDE